jgi:hypothetical protein
MITFPDTILTYMRNMSDSLMTDTCTIEVRSTAKGASGETLQDVYTTVASSVACRLIGQSSQTAMGDRIQPTGDRETVTQQYRIICPYTTALAVDQRITLDSDGSQYQVVDLITARTQRTDVQAMLVRIDG